MISLGIDVGTTTVRANCIEVSVSPVGDRRFRNLSINPLCVFTPFATNGALNVASIVDTLGEWMNVQKVPVPEVGTILFTGEAQRAPNCLDLAEWATTQWEGLVAAQLDPQLECVVAAHGAGAVECSKRRPGSLVVHIDIGGGTSNFAAIVDGEIVDTSCLDLGARKWVINPSSGRVLSRTQVALALEKEHKGVKNDIMTESLAKEFSSLIAEGIVKHAMGGKVSPIVLPWRAKIERQADLISISGGVTECERNASPFLYGDMGPLLMEALKVKLTTIPTVISPQRGRATALGVSTFGFQISGKSVYVPKEFSLPKRNFPLFEGRNFIPREGVSSFVIFLRDVPLHTEGLRDLAHHWAKKALSSLPPKESVCFIFKPNVAKAFGFFLSEEMVTTPFAVLDELELDQDDGSIRTVDISGVMEDRLSVIVKTIRLF